LDDEAVALDFDLACAVRHATWEAEQAKKVAETER